MPDISGIRPVPIARLAQKFSAAGVTPSSILILLKSDRYGLFSGPIKNALDALRIPAVVWTPDKAATNTSAGREMLALLRLSLDVGDDLAGRTAFQAGGLGVGNTAIAAVHQMAAAMAGMSFASAVAAVEANPASLGRSGSAVARAAAIVHDRLRTLAADAPMETSTISEVLDAAASLLEPAPALEAALGELRGLAILWSPASVTDFLKGAIHVGAAHEGLWRLDLAPTAFARYPTLPSIQDRGGSSERKPGVHMRPWVRGSGSLTSGFDNPQSHDLECSPGSRLGWASRVSRSLS